MDVLRLDLMKLAASSPLQHAGARPSADRAPGTGLSFGELLENSMKKVNDLQAESDDLVNKLATGDVDDISRVVLASQRAEFALRMITEVRNKLLDAYQQLGRMPV